MADAALVAAVARLAEATSRLIAILEFGPIRVDDVEIVGSAIMAARAALEAFEKIDMRGAHG